MVVISMVPTLAVPLINEVVHIPSCCTDSTTARTEQSATLKFEVAIHPSGKDEPPNALTPRDSSPASTSRQADQSAILPGEPGKDRVVGGKRQRAVDRW